MGIKQLAETTIKYQKDTLITSTTGGSMWGKGNTCANLVIFPEKYSEVSVGLTLELLPQFDGEQAGIILFINSDNYIKFVREMVNGKQTIVLVKEIDGKPTAEFISPFESSTTVFRLNIRNDLIELYWKPQKGNEFETCNMTNWFQDFSEFQVGLLVHGDNPKNHATFSSLVINNQIQALSQKEIPYNKL